EPIAGASVRVGDSAEFDADSQAGGLPDYETLAVQESTGEQPDAAVATTDEQGIALLPVAAGRYHHLLVVRTGWKAEVRYNLTPAADAPNDVTIELGRALTVRGRVIDQTGTGVPFARVVIAPAAVRQSISMGVSYHTLEPEMNAWYAAATTDPEGHFAIAAVPTAGAPTRVFVLTEARGYRRRLDRVKTADVADGNVLQLTVDRLAMIVATVWRPDGEPLAPGDGVGLVARATSAITPPTQPRDGSHYASAQPAGDLGWAWYATVDEALHALPGTDQVLQLDPRWTESVRYENGGIFGDVVLHRNVPPGRAPDQPYEPPVDGAVRCYRLCGLPAGDWRITATLPGAAPSSIDVTGLNDGETRAVEIRFGAAASIVGQVSGPDGAPLAGAQVVALRPDSPHPTYKNQWIRSATTADDGRFELAALPADTPVRMVVVAAGYQPQRADFTLANGQEQRVDIHLRAWGEVRGNVLDDAGQPVADVTMHASRPGRRGATPDHEWKDWEQMTSVATVMPDGRFVVRGLAEGPYMLYASARGYLSASAEVVVGDSGNVELRLQKLSSLSGTITRRDGTHPDSGYLQVERLTDGERFAGSLEPPEPFGMGSGGDAPTIWYDPATGKYSVHGLAPGRYVLRVFRNRRDVITESTIDLARDAPGQLDFDLD
ncbi:MAG: carboxypeptidase regulatory-like domain-containing protein, partial [Planctomycetota bacterium]